ncbi:DUF3413 domain-containing protein [Vibrio genomosp. F10]|uniref:DUF3413 domain-containing protein n=1 Tax=Vibrio genomosp. F10 TaxID=723171 RepID=UPI0002DDE55B|nr:DUF3413 domain-containing protein [Vibrio genomosp. F10]OEF04491.1 hydrolase [Vibrio genomosp. F10 str. 9ZB36]
MVDSGNTYSERVSRLVGWGHWFAFFNIIAAMLVGTRYITQSPWPETLLGQFYLASSWVGHFGFLVFALYLLVLFPLTFIIPSRKLFRLFSVCFATMGLTVLLIDTQAYQTLNLHLTPLVWELLFNEGSSEHAQGLQHLFIVLPLIFLLQLGLSEWVWRKQRKLSHKHVGRPITAVFFLCFIASHLTYVWSDAYFYNPVTSQKSNFPLSYPMTAKSFMEKHGLLDKDDYLKRLAESEGSGDLVRYPYDKLRFDRRGNNLNILIVSINGLRADSLNNNVMPFTSQYAENALNFTNHYSSSNNMYGIFGLLYGLPSSYAASIKSQASLPVLIDTLTDKKYNFGLFSGDNFDDDLYAETLFRGMPFTGMAFDSASTADSQTIEAWSDWASKSKSPWFSFIELTTIENFSLEEVNSGTAKEVFSQNYQASVKQADQELGTLFNKLDELQLAKNTVVILTSNHGTELNETNTNTWGASTNFSRYQLQVPMVIQWPGKLPATYNHRSSHLDVSVTLLQDLLGVSSNPSDYSSGRNIFDERRRKWILAGDSRELALITSNQTTVIDKFGNFKLYDEEYKRLKDQSPTLPILMQGLTELQRFYAREN